MTKKERISGCSIDFFYWKGILLARPWTEAWIESFVHFILLPLFMTKKPRVFWEKTRGKRLKSKGKILFWILVGHFRLQHCDQKRWIFNGFFSKVGVAVKQLVKKAILNAFWQRKPPLNVERIDASFLLTQNILMQDS